MGVAGLQRLGFSVIIDTTTSKEEFVRDGELMSVLVEAISDACDVPTSRIAVVGVNAIHDGRYLNVTVSVGTRTQEVTDQALSFVRQPTILDQFAQRLCREYHCRAHMEVGDVVDDHVYVDHSQSAGENGARQANLVTVSCNKFSGRSSELCLSKLGCQCYSEKKEKGFSLCQVGSGTHVVGVKRQGHFGEDYDIPIVTSREERTMLGRFRSHHQEMDAADQLSPDLTNMAPALRDDSSATGSHNGHSIEKVMIPGLGYAKGTGGKLTSFDSNKRTDMNGQSKYTSVQ